MKHLYFKSAGFIYAEFSESWLIGAVFFIDFLLSGCHHVRVMSFSCIMVKSELLVSKLEVSLAFIALPSIKLECSFPAKCCIMAQKMWQFWLKQDYPWMSSCESHLNGKNDTYLILDTCNIFYISKTFEIWFDPFGLKFSECECTFLIVCI